MATTSSRSDLRATLRKHRSDAAGHPPVRGACTAGVEYLDPPPWRSLREWTTGQTRDMTDQWADIRSLDATVGDVVRSTNGDMLVFCWAFGEPVNGGTWRFAQLVENEQGAPELRYEPGELQVAQAVYGAVEDHVALLAAAGGLLLEMACSVEAAAHAVADLTQDDVTFDTDGNLAAGILETADTLEAMAADLASALLDIDDGIHVSATSVRGKTVPDHPSHFVRELLSIARAVSVCSSLRQSDRHAQAPRGRTTPTASGS